jgi:hypothetical protein
MRNLLILLTLALSLYSCKPSRILCNQLYPPPPADTTESVVTTIEEIILRDTSFIPADTTAWVQALIECDSTGQALVKNLINKYGERSKITSSFKDNKAKQLIASFNCQCDSAAIYSEYRLRDTTTTTSQRIVEHHNIPVPADLTWWEKFKIQYGGFAMGILLGYILFRVGWFVLKKYMNVQLPFTNFLK